MQKAVRNNNTLDEKCTTLGWEPLQFLLSGRNCIQSTLIKIYKRMPRSPFGWKVRTIFNIKALKYGFLTKYLTYRLLFSVIRIVHTQSTLTMQFSNSNITYQCLTHSPQHLKQQMTTQNTMWKLEDTNLQVDVRPWTGYSQLLSWAL
jgi:hypothetical protein